MADETDDQAVKYLRGAVDAPPGQPSLTKKQLAAAKHYIWLPGAPNRTDIITPAAAPWNGGALINVWRQNVVVSIGTGFLIESDVVVTAKHVLGDAPGYTALGIYPGYDPHHNPGAAHSVNVLAIAVHNRLDIAVIIIGVDQPGTFQLGMPGGTPHPANANIAGYGFPYPDAVTLRYSTSPGPITQQQDTRLHYGISTKPGDSGAPIFAPVDGVQTAIGMHTDGAADPKLGNTGLYFTPAVISDIKVLTSLARQQIPGHP